MKNIKNTITTTITNLRTRAITGIVKILIPDPCILIESIKAHAVCNLADLINTDEVVQDLADEVSRDLTKDDVLSYVMDNGFDMSDVEHQIVNRVADDFDKSDIEDAIIEKIEQKISDPNDIEDRIIEHIEDGITVDEDEVIDRIVENYEVDEDSIIDRIVDAVDIDSKIDTLLRRKVADAFRRIADEMSA
jgi:hypothetical protein